MNNQHINNQEIATAKKPSNDEPNLSLRGTKQSVSLTPKLRFKEFEGNWEKKKLKDININVIDGDRGKNYPNGSDFSNEGYCLFLNAKNVTKKGFSFDVTSFIKKEKDLLLRKGKLKRFDIVLTTRGSVGHIAYYNENILFENLRINSGMVLIRTDSKFVETNYLNKYFRSNQIQNEIKKISFGSAQPQLTVGEIVKFKIAYPNLQEQQKIATFLTVVDDKIQQLTQKKTLLEQYKKGVMQQVFSQQLRFKPDVTNTNDNITSLRSSVIANASEAISNSKNTENSLNAQTSFPDWEEKKLGEVCEMTSSKRVYLNDYVKVGIPFYRGKEISELRLNKSPTDILYITNERYEDFKSKYGVPLKNDILITAVGTLGNVLRIRNDDAFYFKDGNLIWLRKISEKPEFLEILLEWQTRELIKTSIGSTQKALTMVELRKLSFNFPSLKEQQKIATYLSAIDKKLENVQTQIVQTQTFKKGLLQQLFV